MHAARGYYSANPSSACIVLFSPTCFLFLDPLKCRVTVYGHYLPRPLLLEEDREKPPPPSLPCMLLNDCAGTLGRKDCDPLPRATPLKDLSAGRVKRPLDPLLPLVTGGWIDLCCVRGEMNGFPLGPPAPLPLNDRSGARCVD